jgi:putative transposase
MKRFKSLRQVQRFLSSHGLISNLFHLPHGYVSAVQYWAARAHVFERWVEVSGVAAAA